VSNLYRNTAIPVFSSDGLPVSGARAFFYKSGTSTPANVFANDALTVSLGSIVTANGAGMFPNIYLTDDLYRVVLKDEVGVTLFEVDPYQPDDTTDATGLDHAVPMGQTYIGDAAIITTDKAPQGIAYLKLRSGQERLMLKQRVNSTTGDDEDEEVIGQPMHFEVMSYDDLAPIEATTADVGYAHQGISWIEDDDTDGLTWLWQGASSETISTGIVDGKGFARTRWRGSATDASDVTLYTVFPPRNSGRRGWQHCNNFGFASNDGKYLIANTRDLTQQPRADATNQITVFDRKAVEATGGDATNVLPVAGPWPLRYEPTEQGDCIQDYASDGTYLFAYIGRPHAQFWHYVQRYDLLTGHLIDSSPFQGTKATIGDAVLKAASPDVWYSMEGEGCAAKSDGTAIICHIEKRAVASPDTVSFLSSSGVIKNYTPVATAVPMGQGPGTTYWVETTKPANRGTWDPTVQYAPMGAKTVSARRIFEVAPYTGATGQVRMVGNVMGDSRPNGALNTGNNKFSVIYNSAYDYSIYKRTELAGNDTKLVEGIRDDYHFFSDGTLGSVSDYSLRLYHRFNATQQFAGIKINGPSTTNGGGLYVHSPLDTTRPGVQWRAEVDNGGSFDAVVGYGTGATVFQSLGSVPNVSLNSFSSGYTFTSQRAGIDGLGLYQSSANSTFTAFAGINIQFARAASRFAPAPTETVDWRYNGSTGDFEALTSKNIGTPTNPVGTIYANVVNTGISNKDYRASLNDFSTSTSGTAANNNVTAWGALIATVIAAGGGRIIFDVPIVVSSPLVITLPAGSTAQIDVTCQGLGKVTAHANFATWCNNHPELIDMDGVFRVIGPVPASVNVTGDIAANAPTMSVSSASGIAAADYIGVISAGEYCMGITGVSGYERKNKAEWVKVRSISGTTLTLEEPTLDSYANSYGVTAKIIKLAGTVRFTNMVMVGLGTTQPVDSQPGGIYFEHILQPEVTGCSFKGFKPFAVAARECVAGRTSGLFMMGRTTDFAEPNYYGVEINGCLGWLDTGTRGFAMRRVFDCGSSAGLVIADKNAHFDSYSESCLQMPGCHTSRRGLISGATGKDIHGSIYIRGKDWTVQDCHYTQVAITAVDNPVVVVGNAQTTAYASDETADVGNVVIRNVSAYTWNTGILARGTVRSLFIDGFKATGPYFGNGIEIFGKDVRNVTIQNVDIDVAGNPTPGGSTWYGLKVWSPSGVPLQVLKDLRVTNMRVRGFDAAWLVAGTNDAANPAENIDITIDADASPTQRQMVAHGQPAGPGWFGDNATFAGKQRATTSGAKIAPFGGPFFRSAYGDTVSDTTTPGRPIGTGTPASLTAGRNIVAGDTLTNPAATSGQPYFYKASTNGTTGTLAGVTGAATNGNPTLILDAANGNIQPGRFLTVGTAFVGARVLSVATDGVTVTMNTNAAANAPSGTAVTYTAPTWANGGNLV
jgi:hypothetical protein